MARKSRSDSRERMLRATAELMRKQGYYGTGINDIIKHSGAPKGSLYFHFPEGKRQLAREALIRAAKEQRDAMAARAMAKKDAGEALKAVLEMLAEEMVASNFEEGCPIAPVALGLAGEEELRIVCAESFRSWEEIIALRLTIAGRAENEARDLAIFVLSSVEGAMLLARTQRSTRPLEVVGSQLKMWLASKETGP